MMGKTLQIHRFTKNQRNLTRSWNWGLRFAKAAGFTYSVVANSDLRFPLGWFAPIHRLLESGELRVAGPMTNAPGHRPNQQINRLVGGYVVDDRDEAIDRVQKQLAAGPHAKMVLRGGINGFCMVAKTSAWWDCAFSADDVFNPARKMVGNEDEFQRRWTKKHTISGLGIARGSFVFHYRGVSRNPAATGQHATGRYRR
jgi:hypothetical protein